MVSLEKVILKFQQLDEYLSILRKISKTPKETFLKDKILIGSAKYYLQVSIECCLNVANHIIASEKLRAPRDYSDSFMVIQEEKLISSGLGNRLRQMAKFRNRLVHLYGEIEDAYVYEYIKEDLKDIEKFKLIIIKQYKF
ncbi:MAG: DUF86 domain-containing protein [Deltaproteobacteria bacterium]|jgi:uncharacterized protein YutE (UPF0331/DUF86 family)|nr:DUF86 domain-containing protein [Deltaproteobacteria bacterium]MBW2671124.1 DUF86 domain-containing protein [Deltaproteobacteria bacterium]